MTRRYTEPEDALDNLRRAFELPPGPQRTVWLDLVQFDFWGGRHNARLWKVYDLLRNEIRTRRARGEPTEEMEEELRRFVSIVGDGLERRGRPKGSKDRRISNEEILACNDSPRAYAHLNQRERARLRRLDPVAYARLDKGEQIRLKRLAPN